MTDSKENRFTSSLTRMNRDHRRVVRRVAVIAFVVGAILGGLWTYHSL